MFFDFANVFIFIILGLLMTFVIITVSRLLAPRVSDIPDKWLKAGSGLFALIEITVFVGILFLGLIYMWNRGDLKWTKEVPEELEEGVVLEEEKPIMF